MSVAQVKVWCLTVAHLENYIWFILSGWRILSASGWYSHQKQPDNDILLLFFLNLMSIFQSVHGFLHSVKTDYSNMNSPDFSIVLKYVATVYWWKSIPWQHYFPKCIPNDKKYQKVLKKKQTWKINAIIAMYYWK